VYVLEMCNMLWVCVRYVQHVVCVRYVQHVLGVCVCVLNMCNMCVC